MEQKNMRCEHCGCVGVSHERFMSIPLERKRFYGLLMMGIVPAIVFLMRERSLPYCVRCQRRVLGNGVSSRDVVQGPTITPAIEQAPLPLPIHSPAPSKTVRFSHRTRHYHRPQTSSVCTTRRSVADLT